MINISKTHSLLVGAGFLLGTVGMKVLKSEAVHDLAVQGVAAGMRVRNGYQDVVEAAKAQVDDIVAEADYLTNGAETEAEAAEAQAE